MSIYDDTTWTSEPLKFLQGQTDDPSPTTDVVIPAEDAFIEIPVREVEFPDPRSKGKDKVVAISAKRFVDALEAGDKPGVAAKKLGLTLKEINSAEDMRLAIQKLIEVGHVKAEIKKEVIRAGLFKVFVEGIMSDDKDHKKLALEASKQISSDPDVGLLKESEVTVNVNLGSLDESILGVEIPGIGTNPFRKREEE